MHALTLPTKAWDCKPATASGFQFSIAGPQDEEDLRRFGLQVEMPGAIRFLFDRSPDYFRALGVEGRSTVVLICRESESGKLIAAGHRSIKPMWVNGKLASAGYLSGLRVVPGARGTHLLARGYGLMRKQHLYGPATFYLTTIMEDNLPAKAVLTSGRCGLPSYHDFGRFQCVVISCRVGKLAHVRSDVSIRPACVADGPMVLEYLNSEGSSKQFYPQYRLQDFGRADGLLAGLNWSDVMLAFDGLELVGVSAGWDQRAVRRWTVSGYAPWLRCLRRPLNLMSRMQGLPLLPRPGTPLDYFVLSLVCIRNNDPAIFAALLTAIITSRNNELCLAGFHERDPLLQVLTGRPHVPLPSRLYAVAWPDSEAVVGALDRTRVPYLELGAL